ncbi:MAG: NAD-dependent succinate-semialdehyde dehydrogenase [Deltaproteobacteria bacterium]|nr:NAD-dependent succinate-semialdehyde dehydrogenase [Deltaproteobacteria bacterium]MBW1747030.1 NAD-dependent succinate-semialdehyde dehydrogenase [Deltaproteobacteria bacterium]MBW1827371.1 NAD-dependent succinate-semialdehyde dehydrogenase [Deltaproteobacteria bacterium]MBW1968312.1 NAD-dependent succinate-semialdehyde dehydrogenase [Deltaproteobacteria bacterium]MBW2156183.1 NAD-dependent succinate-semialdehyde dehydrogenase [Deltaproteobacteria bacterium]
MYINGRWVGANSHATFPVYNPSNGEKIGDVADGNRDDAQKAIHAAQEAFGLWSGRTAYARSKYLHKAYQVMMDSKEHLARVMTQEQGKPLKASRGEIQYGADFLLWYAEEAKRIYGETIPAPRSDQRFIVLRQPVGVVAAITPWNYPMSMITRKVAPALAAGCTIVLKPAEATPLCAIEIFKIFEKAGIPAGVVNLVTALNPAPIGEVFATHPMIRKITFTGSTQVGKILAKKAADQVKHVSLELGGHAPFIVFEDSDPVYAAKGAVLVKFLNTGQACISPNRIFVHQSIIEPFIEEFKSRVSKMLAGSGFEDGVSIGPLVNDAAIQKVERQVRDAVDQGATLICGGQRLKDNDLDKGFFYAPTLLGGVTPNMLIYREETFGPVAPVITFNTDEEVLEMANDTNYGLAAYVYTRSLSRAMRMFEGLRFGIVGINDINPTAAAAPFGGMKESGLGREGGRDGIAEYLETKLGGFSI